MIANLGNEQLWRNFVLNLVGGGLVERNQVMMEDDKIVATPVTKEKIEKARLKKMLRRKRNRHFQPCPMVTTEIAAYDTKTSTIVHS